MTSPANKSPAPAVQAKTWYLLPSWDGKVRSKHPQGFLEGSGIEIDHATQPSLWYLAASFYKVAKEQGWTKEAAQRELAAILAAARSSTIPPEASPSAYHREAIKLVKRNRWAVHLVFAMVIQLYEARHGTSIYNIDDSDRHTQIEQRIEIKIIGNDFDAQRQPEQERRIRAIVKEAIAEAQRAYGHKPAKHAKRALKR